MSKPVKNLIVESYKKKFADVDGAVLVDIRGVDANKNNSLRSALAAQQVRITVVKNSLAKRAFEGTALADISELLDGPCAMVYGGQSVVEVARMLIKQAKEIENLQFKGALMEGQRFGPDQIDALSKYPTRGEAQAQVIQVILGPAGQVIGAATSAGAAIASILKKIEEKLEKGEQIKKAG